MDIQIRTASPEEAKIIRDFQLEMALETEHLRLDPETVEKGVQAVFNDPSKGQYWVASISDVIVGSMLMTPEWSDWRNATVLWFQSVYVMPKFRRGGIFRQMYNHLKEHVEKSTDIGGLRLYVDKDNKSAQATYESLGMNGNHYRFYEWMKEF